MNQIPEGQLFFRIGEVSRLLEVEPHVLRYWEKRFPQVRPSKSDTGQRRYRRTDVEALFEIKHLLLDEGFTIEGAREQMKKKKEVEKQDIAQGNDARATLSRLRDGLREVLALLDGETAATQAAATPVRKRQLR